ncbi:MAG: DUF5317 family protein [Chloroflexia bacterium]
MVNLFLVLLGAIAGRLCGGRIGNLRFLPLRAGLLVLVSYAWQWVLVRLIGGHPTSLIGLAFVGSYSLLLGFLWVNRGLPGLKLAFVGMILNLGVTIANGGFMPITPQTLVDAHLERQGVAVGERVMGSKDILLPPDRVQLGLLSDDLFVSWPIPLVFSPGDVLVALGAGILVFRGTRPQVRGPWAAQADRSPGSTPTGAV